MVCHRSTIATTATTGTGATDNGNDDDNGNDGDDDNTDGDGGKKAAATYCCFLRTKSSIDLTVTGAIIHYRRVRKRGYSPSRRFRNRGYCIPLVE